MSFIETNPELIKEWHPTKNTLQPSQVSRGSAKKIWWLCSKHENGCCNLCNTIHEWESTVNHRTSLQRKRNCPYCVNQKLCACQSLEFQFPDIAKEWHPTKNGDLLPSQVSKGSHKKVWWQCLNKNNSSCDTTCKITHEWESTIKHRTIGRNCPYCANYKMCGCQSLEYQFPNIAKEWHSTKNDLQPNEISKSSGKTFWWLCSKYKNGCCNTCNTIHEWESTINHRTSSGQNCPYCVNQKLCACQSLEYQFPDIAKEWHPTKNNLQPNKVSKSNGKTFWWLCSKYKNGCCNTCNTIHEWKAVVKSRTRGSTNCPYCANKKLCPCQSLESQFPDIAKEWHPTKNGKLLPSQVLKGSDLKIWWVCSKTHKWQTSVSERTRIKGSNCPICKVNKAERQLHYICKNDDRIQNHCKLRINCIDSYNLDKFPNGRLLEPDQQIVLTNGSIAIIELDEPQHFGSVNWFGSKPSDFRDQLCRDFSKNQYAINNGWHILRISYEEYDDIDFWINTFITKIFNSSSQIILYSNPEKYKCLIEFS